MDSTFKSVVWRSVDDGFILKGASMQEWWSLTFLLKNTSQSLRVERADKNYFIILIPKNTSISDSAIAQLESSKTLDFRLKFLCDLNLLRVVFIPQEDDRDYDAK